MPAAPRLRRTQRKDSLSLSRLIRPVRECALILVKAAPFQQEPMERRIGRCTRWRLRGECFLASLLSPGRPDDPDLGPSWERLTVPVKSPVVYLPTTVPPFGPEPYFGDAAFRVSKGEGHSSPSPLSRWGRFPIFTGEPLVVSRCIRARSRATLSVVRANRTMLGPDQAELGQCFSRLRSLAHRPGQSDPS